MPSPKKNKTEKRLETLAVKTKQQKQAFLDQLPKYPIVQVACEKSGVGRSTYYAWRKEDKTFAKAADTALKSGEHFINDMAESQLIQNIKNGHTTSIIFWLKNHHGSYNDKILHRYEIGDLDLEPDLKIAMAKSMYNSGILTKHGRNQIIIKAGGTPPVDTPESDEHIKILLDGIEVIKAKEKKEREDFEKRKAKAIMDLDIEQNEDKERDEEYHKPEVQTNRRKGANINDLIKSGKIKPWKPNKEV
jgi:hypothetical protein